MSSFFSRPRASRPTVQPPRRWIEADDAMALWRQYNRSGDERLRDRLVLTYAPLVKFIVYRKIGELPASCDVDDLVSAGLEALPSGLRRTRPARARDRRAAVRQEPHPA